jgi:hypothetical protein
VLAIAGRVGTVGHAISLSPKPARCAQPASTRER